MIFERRDGLDNLSYPIPSLNSGNSFLLGSLLQYWGPRIFTVSTVSLKKHFFFGSLKHNQREPGGNRLVTKAFSPFSSIISEILWLLSYCCLWSLRSLQQGVGGNKTGDKKRLFPSISIVNIICFSLLLLSFCCQNKKIFLWGF